MARLSQTSKMPCPSWSLEAIATCPGAVRPGGELVDACKGCYATTGFYRMPAAVKSRQANRNDWRRREWALEMVEEVGKHEYFRWFDSGDIYDTLLANKIVHIVKNTPNTKHWIPTRMWKFSKFTDLLEQLNSQPNCVVRYSSDHIDGTFGLCQGEFRSTIVPTAEDVQCGVLCQAATNDGKCGDCRACWDKEVHEVNYLAHGAKMSKVIRLKEERA